jgi:hypothetical protein
LTSTRAGPGRLPAILHRPDDAYAAVTGQSVPVRIGTGFTVMDAKNIDDPNIRKFVYSD